MVQIRLDRTGEAHVVYVPVWVALVRLPLSYVVDWLPLGIGFWLIPNINRSRQTVADYITRCVNYRDKALPNPVHMPGAQRDWP